MQLNSSEVAIPEGWNNAGCINVIAVCGLGSILEYICLISWLSVIRGDCTRQFCFAVFCDVWFYQLYLVCVFSCTVLFASISQLIGCEDCLQKCLYCVWWGIKVCSNPIVQVYCSCKDFICVNYVKFETKIVYYWKVVNISTMHCIQLWRMQMLQRFDEYCFAVKRYDSLCASAFVCLYMRRC